MQTTKIRIKNLFGLTDLSLDGSSVEITGAKGTGCAEHCEVVYE